MKPIKPTKPKLPTKPVLQEPLLFKTKTISCAECATLADVLALIPNLTPEEVVIEFYTEYDSHHCCDMNDGEPTLFLSFQEAIPEKEIEETKVILQKYFEQDIIRYEKDIKTYPKLLEKYKKEIKEYKEVTLPAWEAKQAEKKEKKRKTLEKKLARLNK